MRWFDQWLKGEDTGILDEPDLAVYVRDYYAPDPAIERVPGRWRWEDSWPIKRTEVQEWFADADHGLSPDLAEDATHEMRYKASVGLEGGGPTMWWGSVTPDQQAMDDHSLVYDSEPLDKPLEILGRPLAKLNVSADAPHVNWVVRISDVAPDGQVTQVAGAAINGSQRESTRNPKEIVPGEAFSLEIALHFSSWVFPEGHRIRVAISNAQWPMLWPTPYPANTTLAIGGADGARILLPVIPPGDQRAPDFRPPAPNPVLAGYETLDSGNVTGYAAINEIQHDPDTNEAFGVAKNTGATRYPWGIERYTEEIEYRTSDENPAETSVVGRYKLSQELDDRVIDFEQRINFTSDAENFTLRIHRSAVVDGETYAENVWEEAVPRDHQ